MSDKNNRFIVTQKPEKSVTFTVRLDAELYNKIEEIAGKSGRSRNELINRAVRFALENLELDL